MTLPANAVLNANVHSAAAIARTKLALEAQAPFAVPLSSFRVWNAMATNLPGTAADDDLAFVGGTFGTDFPQIQSSNFEGTTATQRARAIIALPENYETGEDCLLNLWCKMTAVAQVSATVDVEAYRGGTDFLVNGADICATAAQSINSTTVGFKQFVLGGSGLNPGDHLDVRITVAGDDTGGSGAVIAQIGFIWLHCDIRG